MISKTHPAKSLKKRGRGRPAGTAGTKHRQPEGPSAGVVSDFESLRLDAFCKRMGFSRAFVNQMGDEGLPIRKVGRYRVIRGADWNTFTATRPCTTSRDHSEEVEGKPAESGTLASGEGSV